MSKIIEESKNYTIMGKKNKGRKTLTALSAVVAAGLTPGVISGAPFSQAQPNAGITAADVVAIDGNTFSFDEILAMQQGIGRWYAVAPGELPQVAARYGVQRPPQVSTHYGVPHPKKTVAVTPPALLEEIQESLLQYCDRLIDADKRFIVISLDSDLTRDLGMSPDELKKLAEKMESSYGVEKPDCQLFKNGPLNTLRQISQYIYDTKKPSAERIKWDLMGYCAQLLGFDIRRAPITLDSDLTRDLGMTEDELKALAAEIKDRYGVEVSYNRFRLVGQLNTLRLITEHIYKIKHLWD